LSRQTSNDETAASSKVEQKKANIEEELFGGIKMKNNNYIQNSIRKTKEDEQKQFKRIEVSQFKNDHIGRLGGMYTEVRHDYEPDAGANKIDEEDPDESGQTSEEEEAAISGGQPSRDQASRKKQLDEGSSFGMYRNMRVRNRVFLVERAYEQLFKNVYLFWNKQEMMNDPFKEAEARF